MTNADILAVLLPDQPVGADAAAHWWRIGGGKVVDRGVGSDWAATGADIVGLAPTSALRLALEPPGDSGMPARQAASVARLRAAENNLGDPQTLHIVAAPVDADAGPIAVVVVANDTMLGWLDWAGRCGVSMRAIVPAALALPPGPGWQYATVGSDAIFSGDGRVVPDEPAIREALFPADAEAQEVDPDTVEDGIAALAANPVPNLRVGRFAPRRIVIDRARVRELGYLLLAIVAVTTLIAIVEIVRLNRSADALDAETLAIARQAAGPGVTLETAEAELAGRSSGAVSAPLAAVVQRLQAEPGVSITNLGFNGGTASVTLAAADAASINRVLLSLQRDGYSVTAVARQGSDGRSMADVTLRGAS